MRLIGSVEGGTGGVTLIETINYVLADCERDAWVSGPRGAVGWFCESVLNLS